MRDDLCVIPSMRPLAVPTATASAHASRYCARICWYSGDSGFALQSHTSRRGEPWDDVHGSSVDSCFTLSEEFCASLPEARWVTITLIDRPDCSLVFSPRRPFQSGIDASSAIGVGAKKPMPSVSG